MSALIPTPGFLDLLAAPFRRPAALPDRPTAREEIGALILNAPEAFTSEHDIQALMQVFPRRY